MRVTTTFDSLWIFNAMLDQCLPQRVFSAKVAYFLFQVEGAHENTNFGFAVRSVFGRHAFFGSDCPT